jgi:hypothetical protein
MKAEELFQTAASRIERIRVRNALNPLLWLSVTAPILFLPAAWFFRDYPVVLSILIFLAGIPVIATIVAYMILLFKNPDRLLSEEYQLRHREIQMRYRRGRKPEVFDAANYPVQYKASLPQIENGEK